MNKSIWERFVAKETYDGRIPEGKRKYHHFDRKIHFTSSIDFLKGYLSNTNNVARKSLYPFIRQTLVTPRYKYDEKLDKRKIDNKEREICYAAHFDALIYSYYSIVLDTLYEEKILNEFFSDSIIAYRKLGKNNIYFAKEVFDYIKSKGDCVALAFDISNFFDNLNHSILKEAWCNVLNRSRLPEDHFNLYKSLTRFSFVERSELIDKFNISPKQYPDRICTPKEFRDIVRGDSLIHTNLNDYGIPQGSPMSAILSNIYMYDFDKELYSLVKKYSGLYRRYSDDIIIVVNKDKHHKIKEKYYNLVSKFKLESKKEKECIRFFREEEMGKQQCIDIEGKDGHLQYLGFIYDGNHVWVRSSSISKYYRKMRNNVRETVKRALSKNSHNSKVRKRRLYKRFTHKGSSVKGNLNFITYVYNASEIMGEKKIKQQVSKHVKKMNQAISEKKKKIGESRDKRK